MNKQVPKAIRESKDARDLFGYFFRKAALGSEPAMRPVSGRLRKVVLFNNDFTNKMVEILEQTPNVRQLMQGVEEVRLIATSVTPGGVERLRKLLPDVYFAVFTSEGYRRNRKISNPDYDLGTGVLHVVPLTADEIAKKEAAVEALWRDRYGPNVPPPGMRTC